MSRGWAKGSACRLQITLSCAAVLCHIVSLQYLTRSSLHRLAGLPWRLFLSYYTSFNCGLCGRKFVLCLFGHCPGICAICPSWQHTGVVHPSLQADFKVAFEDMPVFGVCCPACHNSSLYLFVAENEHWRLVEDRNGQVGYAPAAFLVVILDTTAEEEESGATKKGQEDSTEENRIGGWIGQEGERIIQRQ